MNNIRTVFTSKRLNFPASYGGRADVVLQRNIVAKCDIR